MTDTQDVTTDKGGGGDYEIIHCSMDWVGGNEINASHFLGELQVKSGY